MRFEAKRAAAALHITSRLPIAVATTVDDGEGGVFVQVGYAAMPLADCELVVGTMLRDMRDMLEADFHDCDACRRRMARITDALAALERDGAKPTGLQRGEAH